MEGTETLKFHDRDQRDKVFHALRTTGFANERQVVKYSDVENNESVFFVAYPKDIHGHRVRARVKRQEKLDAFRRQSNQN